MNILVADPLSPAAVAVLRAQPGWNVIESDPKGFREHLANTDALVVRSGSKVTAEVLAAAPRLRAIGRAGVGVDNVDLKAATAAGVIVMNTPGGNAVAVAEHTLALMLAMARSIPQASASTKSGKWEKKKFMGSELRGKTLGIVGAGSIGREVVRRAKAFEMKVLAFDPYVSAHAAADVGITLVSLEDLYAQSDYVSLHMALTPETTGMINDTAFEMMKPGVRLVNCARGELVDAPALARALASKKVAGAALDVFATEPPGTGEPLLAFDNVIATPHIGGSTEEAQEIVGLRIAEQLKEYLLNDIAINAVNMPQLTPEQYKAIGPYIALAEKLGRFAGFIAADNAVAIRVGYTGEVANENTLLLRNSALAGVLSRSLGGRVNAVNAMQIAGDRGLEVSERHDRRPGARASRIRVVVETIAGSSTVEGGVALDGKPRLLQVDGIPCEAPLDGHLTYCRNYDVPGVIGFIGSVMGQNGVNIAHFSLGRETAPSGPQVEAMSVIETDAPVPEAVLAEIRANAGIKVAIAVDLAVNGAVEGKAAEAVSRQLSAVSS